MIFLFLYGPYVLIPLSYGTAYTDKLLICSLMLFVSHGKVVVLKYTNLKETEIV